MTGSIYRRMGQLLFHFWPYILISSISAIIFVLLNSISIWLTASFINNVLTDFDKIVQSQMEWASKSNLTANEKLKYWTNLFILRDTPTESLKILCFTILFGVCGLHMGPQNRLRSPQDGSKIVLDRFFCLFNFRFDF